MYYRSSKTWYVYGPPLGSLFLEVGGDPGLTVCLRKVRVSEGTLVFIVVGFVFLCSILIFNYTEKKKNCLWVLKHTRKFIYDQDGFFVSVNLSVM